jgi:hypothetical protein
MATGRAVSRLPSASIAWMSLRGALVAFDSDEKFLVLILDKSVSEYVDDHHQKDAMKLPLLMNRCSMYGREASLGWKLRWRCQCLKKYVQEYDLSGTFDR